MRRSLTSLACLVAALALCGCPGPNSPAPQSAKASPKPAAAGEESRSQAARPDPPEQLAQEAPPPSPSPQSAPPKDPPAKPLGVLDGMGVGIDEVDAKVGKAKAKQPAPKVRRSQPAQPAQESRPSHERKPRSPSPGRTGAVQTISHGERVSLPSKLRYREQSFVYFYADW